MSSDLIREDRHVAQARDVCLRLLAARARSRAELERKLADKGYDEAVRTEVLDRLVAVGLLNDQQFAHDWVRQQHSRSGKVGAALAHGLRAHGVAEEDAQAAMEQLDPEQREGRARELVQRKLGRSSDSVDPSDQRLVGRLVGMLARRGYDSGLALRVVRSELAVLSAG
ncbi:MAG: regulatory protein RecX [Segniliparus sp.]|uniref:regulatory protein RecX n=1 Tax=Segniliparus sp. TaxID=2804064 RepID=UPI003F372BB5